MSVRCVVCMKLRLFLKRLEVQHSSTCTVAKEVYIQLFLRQMPSLTILLSLV